MFNHKDARYATAIVSSCIFSTHTIFLQEEKMKFFLGLLVGLMIVGTVHAQTSVNASIGGFSGYIWRGGILGADNKALLQPSVTLGFGDSGLSFNVWGSFFVQSRTATKGADELDFTLDYTKTLSEESGMSVSIGYVQYTFPSLDTKVTGLDKHTEEPYIGISLANPVSPSVKFYYDFNNADGWYLVASGSYAIPIGEGEDAPALNIGVSAAASSYVGKTGFNDVTATASVGLTAGRFTISPMAGFSYADSKINIDKSSFWGGVTIGIPLGGE